MLELRTQGNESCTTVYQMLELRTQGNESSIFLTTEKKTIHKLNPKKKTRIANPNFFLKTKTKTKFNERILALLARGEQKKEQEQNQEQEQKQRRATRGTTRRASRRATRRASRDERPGEQPEEQSGGRVGGGGGGLHRLHHRPNCPAGEEAGQHRPHCLAEEEAEAPPS